MMRSFQSLLLGAVLLFSACAAGDEDASYTGIVEGKTWRIAAFTGGQLMAVHVDEGTHVAQGDLIAESDSSTWNIELARMDATLAELTAQQEMAAATLQSRKRDLAFLSQKKQRLQKLARDQALAGQQLDDLDNQLQQAKTALTLAAGNQQVLVAKAKQAHAARQLAAKKLAECQVRAPASGKITAIYYRRGELSPPGAAIAELVSLREAEVKIYVSERVLPDVQLGQHVRVHAGLGVVATEGRVVWISPKAEFSPKSILTPETRASLVYAVKIVIENSDDKLKHGMPVDVFLNDADPTS